MINKNTHKQNKNKSLTDIHWKQKLKNIAFGKSTGRRMFRLYFLLILIFSCLLYMPFSFQSYIDNGFSENLRYVNNQYEIVVNNQVIEFNFLSSLFTSFSAFSDTGLSLISLHSTLSTFGKIIMMIEMQIGGFGVMFFIFLFWKIFKRQDKISINQWLLAQSEKGNTKIGNTDKMLIRTAFVVIIIEILFGLFYSLWFYYVPSYEPPPPMFQPIPLEKELIPTKVYDNLPYAFFAGFFHSVASINNAGFDIIGDTSLMPFRNGVHTIFLFFTMIEFTIGGIGFPVIFDILSKFKLQKQKVIVKEGEVNKKKTTIRLVIDKNYKISLFSKIAIISFTIISIFGITLMFIFECTSIADTQRIWNNKNEFFGPNGESLTTYNKSFNLIFQSLTTRSAGFYTIYNGDLSTISKWLNITLMFIGGSPSSTAGGIRVTTVAIIFICLFHKFKGSKNYFVFKRELYVDEIINSFLVFFISVVLVALGGIVMLNDLYESVEAKAHMTHFTDTIFLSSSAFGTTGLSSIYQMNDLDWYSLLYLMFLMFIGQCGVSSTIFAFRRNKIKENLFSYVPENIKIG